jgi:hypothetical protein
LSWELRVQIDERDAAYRNDRVTRPLTEWNAIVRRFRLVVLDQLGRNQRMLKARLA